MMMVRVNGGWSVEDMFVAPAMRRRQHMFPVMVDREGSISKKNVRGYAGRADSDVMCHKMVGPSGHAGLTLGLPGWERG